jgi:hypothetical protein
VKPKKPKKAGPSRDHEQLYWDQGKKWVGLVAGWHLAPRYFAAHHHPAHHRRQPPALLTSLHHLPHHLLPGTRVGTFHNVILQ